MTRHDPAQAFSDLHRDATFVLMNAWDAASAAVIEAAGGQAIGTTSSGISWALGVPDGENLTRADAVSVTARIAAAVDIPVSADIESGYGPAPHDVAETTRLVIAAGAVGINLEDRPGPEGQILWPVELQHERLAAARMVADQTGRPFVINARTDVFLAAVGEADQREAMVLERAASYRAAGADCLFVPGLIDIEVIGRLVARSPLPLNILLAPGRGPSIGELTAAGVRRISVGHTMAAAAYGTVRRATENLLVGDDRLLVDGIRHPEMQELMSS